MKKYIVILLSFGLFSLPLGTFAQVDVSACTSATTEDICNAGCEWNSDNTTCTICPQGTYSTDGIYGCKPCIKPTNAEFILASGYEYAGMTSQDECPWTVSVCDENMYIKDLKRNEWNANTELSKDLCSPCDDGQYADNTTQTWENYSLSNPCKPKRFYIVPKLKIQRPDGMITVTPANLSFNYDYGSGEITTIENFQNKILEYMTDNDKISPEEMKNKYKFPPDGTEFILEPQGVSGPSITVRYYTTKLEVKTASIPQFKSYPNHTTFNIPITMVPETYNICYCSKTPDGTRVSSISNTCNCKNNIEFGTMQTASPMSSELHTKFQQDCNGKYLSQWNGYLYQVSTPLNYMELKRPFDQPIDVNKQINEPDSSNQFIILTPKYDLCKAGEFSNNPICPIKCEDCAAGTISASGASKCENCPAGTISASGASKCENCPAGTFSAEGSTTCSPCPKGFKTKNTGTSSITDCYIDNTTMKFIDNNGTSNTVISSPVYYVGKQ